MSDESTGRLPAQIVGHSKRIREMCGQLTGRINEIRSLVASPRVTTADLVTSVCGDMKLDVIGLLSELNAIDACIAAARMTGQIITAPTATDLELHPRNLPCTTPPLPPRVTWRDGKLAAANDHTYDNEEGEK